MIWILCTIAALCLVGCCRAFYAWGYNKGRIDEMKGEPRARGFYERYHT